MDEIRPFSEGISTGTGITEAEVSVNNSEINEFGVAGWIWKAGKVIAQKIAGKTIPKTAPKVLTTVERARRAEADKAFKFFENWLTERELPQKKQLKNLCICLKIVKVIYSKTSIQELI